MLYECIKQQIQLQRELVNWKADHKKLGKIRHRDKGMEVQMYTEEFYPTYS